MGFRTHRRPVGQLGRIIRHMRKRLNLSQPELETKLGWPADLITKYERGYFKPDTARLIRLLELAEGEERVAMIGALEVRGVRSADLAPHLTIQGTTPPPSPEVVLTAEGAESV